VDQQARRGFAVVVIGASGGGVTAIQELFAHLPKDIPAAILITLHVGRHKSLLPAIIRHYGFAAYHARQGALISPPCIIVAPPDHHLLIRRGHVALSRGPRENWARPAIDPMFRSAATAYDGHVIGVVLSGYLNDGTAGLFAVKRGGGIAVVQEPTDASCPAMPASAMSRVAVDYCVSIADMPGVLYRAAKEIARRASPPPQSEGLRHA
jgi:two-component system, chemotaxis family, protein-glutamate methylesterase/glutaminase